MLLGFDRDGAALEAALEAVGEMPLPPYIAARRPADAADRQDYQTVFAARPGAVAAPTASLHFDAALLAELEARGVGAARDAARRRRPATRVADLHGAGTQTSPPRIIAHAGDVRRFRDAAAFARFCGAAPIPCGSGQTAGRHRLHRGGNRELNAALYRIAIVQQRHRPARPRHSSPARSAEGKTPREARRALKRHLADVGVPNSLLELGPQHPSHESP